jgi:C-terminal processing protease CtpA/Prc
MGKFVGLGIEVGMEDGYVKVISPSRIRRPSAPGSRPAT